MIAFITERIKNRPTIGGSLLKMGKPLDSAILFGCSKPSSQESHGKPRECQV